MRVQVDVNRCIGAGQCVFIEPLVFAQREEDGRVVLIETNIPVDRHPSVLEAESMCPSGAIHVLDDA